MGLGEKGDAGGGGGARPWPVGMGVSPKSSHSSRGGFKLFSEVCGSAQLTFLHLSRAMVTVGLGEHQPSQAPATERWEMQGGSSTQCQKPLAG